MSSRQQRNRGKRRLPGAINRRSAYSCGPIVKRNPTSRTSRGDSCLDCDWKIDINRVGRSRQGGRGRDLRGGARNEQEEQ